MQMACIESARSTGIDKASTTEFGPTTEPVVGLITEWDSPRGREIRAEGGDLGGTMRLGAFPARISGNSNSTAIYRASEISERHSHSYAVVNTHRDNRQKAGLDFTGRAPEGVQPADRGMR